MNGPPYTRDPPGDWPKHIVDGQWVSYCRCTFDAWPELWEGIEQARLRREARAHRTRKPLAAPLGAPSICNLTPAE